MRNLIARLVFSLWPHFVGLDRLMGIIRPTVPADPLAKRKIRGYPLWMKFSPHTYMGKFLYYRGIYEEGVIQKLNELLETDMNFVDVGANAGMYTLIASHLVGPQGKVVAFEPQSRLREVINTNLELNQLQNVEVRPEALGRVASEGKLFQVNKDNDGQATTRIAEHEKSVSAPENVTIVTLYDILREIDFVRLDGMKIDVEGAEYDALLGLKPLLESAPPKFIFFECIDAHLNRFGANSGMLFDYLMSHGYELFCLWRGKWRRVRTEVDHQRYSFSTDFLALQASEKRAPNS